MTASCLFQYMWIEAGSKSIRSIMLISCLCEMNIGTCQLLAQPEILLVLMQETYTARQCCCRLFCTWSLWLHLNHYLQQKTGTRASVTLPWSAERTVTIERYDFLTSGTLYETAHKNSVAYISHNSPNSIFVALGLWAGRSRGWRGIFSQSSLHVFLCSKAQKIRLEFFGQQDRACVCVCARACAGGGGVWITGQGWRCSSFTTFKNVQNPK